MNYLEWEDHRKPEDEPSFSEGWANSRITRLPDFPADLTDIFECTDWERTFCGQLELDLAPPVDLYLRRNRLEETSFLYDFFHHPVIAEQLAGYEALNWPAGADWTREPTLRLRREGSWVTTARLAQTLQFGPAIGPNRCTDHELKRLLPRFAEAAFFGEYSKTIGYSGFEPWSPWFCGQHFDSTYLWINKGRGIATVVLMSDRP